MDLKNSIPNFNVALRGYDRDEVEEYLDSLAKSLADADDAEEHIRRLQLQVSRMGGRIRELEERIAADTPRTGAVLGEKIGLILRQAEEAATDTISRAEDEARHIESEARTRASEITSGAEARASARTRQIEDWAQDVIAHARDEEARVLAEIGRLRERSEQSLRGLEAERDATAEKLTELRNSIGQALEQIEPSASVAQPEPAPAPASPAGSAESSSSGSSSAESSSSGSSSSGEPASSTGPDSSSGTTGWYQSRDWSETAGRAGSHAGAADLFGSGSFAGADSIVDNPEANTDPAVSYAPDEAAHDATHDDVDHLDTGTDSTDDEEDSTGEGNTVGGNTVGGNTREGNTVGSITGDAGIGHATGDDADRDAEPGGHAGFGADSTMDIPAQLEASILADTLMDPDEAFEAKFDAWVSDTSSTEIVDFDKLDRGRWSE